MRRAVACEGRDAVGTLAMWFIAVPVLGRALWRTFVKKDWR